MWTIPQNVKDKWLRRGLSIKFKNIESRRMQKRLTTVKPECIDWPKNGRSSEVVVIRGNNNSNIVIGPGFKPDVEDRWSFFTGVRQYLKTGQKAESLKLNCWVLLFWTVDSGESICTMSIPKETSGLLLTSSKLTQ